MRRRDFTLALGAAGAALLAPGAAWAQDDDVEGDVTPSMLDEIQLIQGQRIDAVGPSNAPATERAVLRIHGTDAGHAIPPLTDDLRTLLAEENYWALAQAQQPQPTWMGAHAPDYRHLEGFSLSSAQFELDAGVLNRLAAANAFVLNELRPVLVFGLRGCKMLSGANYAPWAATHRLEAADPSHLDCGCVLGLLRKSDGMIALYRATTVPAVAAMYKALPINGGGTSMLPTGFYEYSVGTVRADNPRSIQRGALRISGSYCVLRTADDVVFDPYSPSDAWTRGALHQIHAGGANLGRPGSNGCQVIPGGYTGEGRRMAHGVWADFRRDAGLTGEDGLAIADDTSPTFQYMLLTGREAALAYQGGNAFQNGYRRLRHGSTGNAVRNRQRQLFRDHPIEGAQADGNFGMLTSFASLLDKKATVLEFTTPIISI